MEKLNKYELFLLESLNENKILVSNELCQLLEDSFKVKSANARKIVQRAANKNIIKTSAPLTFGKGQYAYYKSGTSFTKDKIKKVCKLYRPSIYRLLVALDINEGIISYYEAIKIVASPLTKNVSKVDYLDDLITVLSKLEIIYEIPMI